MTGNQGKVNWLDTFRDWFGQHGDALSHEGITVDIPAETRGSGIYADLKSERYEVTVQLWSNGLSDFHVADFQVADLDPNYQVEVTHHEFQSEDEMLAALDDLIKRLIDANKPSVGIASWPLSGYSESVYIDPSVGERLSTHAAKRKSK